MPESICSRAAHEGGLTPSDLQRLVDVARAAADAGGQELMRHYGRLSTIESKGRIGDLVTNADVAAEGIVLKLLAERTPEIAVLAEESGAAGQQDGLRWCVDPLDGTTNFAHGYPFFATSIGLTLGQQPILGAIAVPFLNEMYWGAPGIGAFCNDSPLQVSSCDRLEDSLLVTGFAYDRHTRLDNNYAEFCWFTHRTHGVRRGGAAAVDLAFVAAGRQDGYWERGLSLGSSGWGGVGGSGRWNRHRVWQSTLRPFQRSGRCRWRQPACSDHRWVVPGEAPAGRCLRCARGHGHGILRRGREDVRWRCNLQLAQRI